MKRVLAATAAIAVLSLHPAAQTSVPDAGALINAATTAMGGAKLRSLQYTATGSFGAHMQVALINEGPVTIVLDSAIFRAPRHG